ncbi:MAG TPA: cytochrome c [Polyangiaceae bacterium]|nr:cytochrome c [Polyangiaceae bacterium]
MAAKLGIAAATLSGCDRPAADLRVWQAADHDHTDQPNAAQVEVKPGATASGPLAEHGIDDVTLATWKENCMRCHGQFGAGDGPQGPMNQTRNLTDPAWQASMTDQQIAQSIHTGKGRMPAFNLPEHTVSSLVRLIRMMKMEARSDETQGADQR